MNKKTKKVFLVLQGGHPMQLAETKSETWALFFARRKPTVFTNRKAARNAILRQKYREIQTGRSLGDLRILTVPVI